MVKRVCGYIHTEVEKEIRMPVSENDEAWHVLSPHLNAHCFSPTLAWRDD